MTGDSTDPARGRAGCRLGGAFAGNDFTAAGLAVGVGVVSFGSDKDGSNITRC